MTFDYAKSAATALRLIAKFGQIGVVRRSVVAGGGPTDPTGGASNDTDYAATLVVLPIDARDVDGTAIKSTDVRIYVASSVAITPTTTDQVIAGSDVYTILRCNALEPAGTFVLYDIVGRA